MLTISGHLNGVEGAGRNGPFRVFALAMAALSITACGPSGNGSSGTGGAMGTGGGGAAGTTGSGAPPV